MTAAYKKRAKGGWSGGKAHKENSNRCERNYEDKDIQEHLEETSKVSATTVTKKKNDHKDITRFLSRMRWIYKLCKGDMGYFIKPRDGRNDWIMDYYQKYYQEYKKGVPQLIELSKRDDLPSKILRQIKELIVLFGIETP